MVFKCGPIELVYSFSIVLAELVKIEIEIKMLNIQIINKDLNGLNNLCLRNVFNFFVRNFLSFPESLVRS